VEEIGMFDGIHAILAFIPENRNEKLIGGAHTTSESPAPFWRSWLKMSHFNCHHFGAFQQIPPQHIILEV
jgi:hypothetical protein